MSPRASTCSTRRPTTQLLRHSDPRRAAGAAADARQRARPRARDRHHRGGRPDLPRRRQRSDRQARRDSALDRTCRQRRGRDRRTVAQCFGVAPDDTTEAVEAEFFSASLIADDGMAGCGRRFGRRLESRSRAYRPAASSSHALGAGERRIEHLSRDLLHGQACAAQKHRHQGDSRQDIPHLCRAPARRAGARLRTARPRARHCVRATAPAALLTIAAAVIARYQAREGPPRRCSTMTT